MVPFPSTYYINSFRPESKLDDEQDRMEASDEDETIDTSLGKKVNVWGSYYYFDSLQTRQGCVITTI